MAVLIGAGPIGWYSQDQSAFSNEIAREYRLQQAARGGFDGLDLDASDPQEVAGARAALARHGLGFVAATHDLHLRSADYDVELGRLRRRLRQAKALGATFLTVAETTGSVVDDAAIPLSKRPQLSMTAWVDFGEALANLCRAAAAEGMRLVYRPQVGTIVQTPGDIDQLMAATGSAVGLMLDVGQIVWGDGNPVELARRYANALRVVQGSAVDARIIAEVRSRDESYASALAMGVLQPASACVDMIEAVLAEVPRFDGWVMLDAERGADVATVAHRRSEPVEARRERQVVHVDTWYRFAA